MESTNINQRDKLVTNFKFKFKYITKTLKATGDGTVKAETMDAAIVAASAGVAKDFGGSADNVVITSISKFTPRKKKVK